MRNSIGGSLKKCVPALCLLAATSLSGPASAYVVDPNTEGWDGTGLGSATINYYVGWSGAPGGNNGLTNDGSGGSGLTLAQIESALQSAMASWSAVADITFTSLGNAVSTPSLAGDPWGSPGNETLVFYFHQDEAGGDGFPFDGAGLTSVFAHAWGPPDTVIPSPGYAWAGNIHADGAENWLVGSFADGTLYSALGGIDLETILLHELGHSLGLDHVGSGFANVGGSVMEPYSNSVLRTLQPDDIAGIRQLYSFQGQDWSNGDPGAGPGDPTVPEPGTLLLLAAGLGGLLGLRRAASANR